MRIVSELESSMWRESEELFRVRKALTRNELVQRAFKGIGTVLRTHLNLNELSKLVSGNLSFLYNGIRATLVPISPLRLA